MPFTRPKLLAQLGSVLLLVPLVANGAQRTYAAGSFLLEIPEGTKLFLKSFAGGNAVQVPFTRGTRADKYPDKAPGAVRYEDVQVELPVTSASSVWSWVNVFSSPEVAGKKTLTVSTLDHNLVETSRRVFEGSLINFVELPACDASSKEPSYFKLGFAVASARDSTGTAGAKVTVPRQEKAWLPANFRLSVDEMNTTRVASVSPITIRRSATGAPEYSNVVITLPTSDEEPWKQWTQQSIAGKPTERNGKLEYLSPNFQEVYLTARLEGLGVVRMGPRKVEANADQVARTEVELYVEKVTFSTPR